MTASNYKKVKQVLWIILFANLMVSAIKIVLGIATKSASTTADGFHSLADGSSNIVGLIGISIAAKPKDEDHHYGHRKYESLASLVIAGMLFVVGGNIVTNSVSRFTNPFVPSVSPGSVFILVLTLIVNIIVSSLEYKYGKNLNSEILISDSMHTRSDIYISIGVITTLICIKFGLPPIIDPIVSLIIACAIIYTAYEIFTSVSGTLLDKATIDIREVEKIVHRFPQVKNIHKIRSRDDGADIHIDMHIVTEPDMSIEESHNLIHTIEKTLQKEINYNTQLIAHFEPFKKEEDEPESN